MNLNYRSYLHFDKKLPIRKAKKYLKDLSHHEYLPFITYEIPKHKWDNNHIYLKESRIISICSHKDNYVYQYFNNKINNQYEAYIRNIDIDKNICAFRKKIGKCNVDFAKEALTYITSHDSCYVIIADISKFFDNLDHKILKNNLKKVLNVTELSADIYKMFKSITKTSYLTIDDIYQILKQEGFCISISQKKNLYKDINEFGKKYNWQTILTKEMFKKYKNTYIKPTKEELKIKSKGIAQGAPISGTLSNIYMIDFDKKVNELVNKLDGKYLRYCDDFLIAIPNFNDSNFNNLINNINSLIKEINLEIKKEKYQLYKYQNKQAINLNNNNKNKRIQFLGLELNDNNEITIRRSTQDRNKNKKLKIIKRLYGNIEDIRTIIYKRTIEDGPIGDYNNYTYGNYQSKVADKIGGQKLKMIKKKEIEFIDKHLKKNQKKS